MTRFHYTKLKLDYLQEKYNRFEKEEVTSKFTNANLVDTRIITKYARAYLNSYFKRVNVINGQITDTMRKVWGLQGEHEQKDRSNHIHHCIDAITVACVEKGTANRISAAYHQYEKDYFNGNESAKIFMKEPMVKFVPTMKELHKEVFIFHLQRDRIKPMLEEQKKENTQKLDLRGPLNSQNPYGHRKDDDGEFFFVQRQSITKVKEKDIKNIIDDRIRERIEKLCSATGKKVEKLVAENNGYLLLPKYEAINSKGKKTISSPMVIKKLRLKSSKTKLNPYKKIRKIDLSKKVGQAYKHDFYYDKEPGSNYEAILYGELVPNEKGKLKREYRLINHYNIVNGIYKLPPTIPKLFPIHVDDMFLVFDKHPDEITWSNKEDLQSRLFKSVKFDDNGILVFERHSYALGNVDRAKSVKENDLREGIGVVLRRSPSTLRTIPTKVDALGRIDIEFSKKFIEDKMRR